MNPISAYRRVVRVQEIWMQCNCGLHLKFQILIESMCEIASSVDRFLSRPSNACSVCRPTSDAEESALSTAAPFGISSPNNAAMVAVRSVNETRWLLATGLRNISLPPDDQGNAMAVLVDVCHLPATATAAGSSWMPEPKPIPPASTPSTFWSVRSRRRSLPTPPADAGTFGRAPMPGGGRQRSRARRQSSKSMRMRRICSYCTAGSLVGSGALTVPDGLDRRIKDGGVVRR